MSVCVSGQYFGILFLGYYFSAIIRDIDQLKFIYDTYPGCTQFTKSGENQHYCFLKVQSYHTKIDKLEIQLIIYDLLSSNSIDPSMNVISAVIHYRPNHTKWRIISFQYPIIALYSIY